MSLKEAAQKFIASGLCALPAIVAEKRPAVAEWKRYQHELPANVWTENATAVCVLTGKVSGNLEMIDFDNGGELFERWLDLVDEAAPGLANRLVVERTQSDGFHVIYRAGCEISGNKKLAQRTLECGQFPVRVGNKEYVPRRAGDKWVVTFSLIETRGEGGLFLCSPSPGYSMVQGEIENPPTITADERQTLIDAAITLSEYTQTAKPRAEPSPAGSRPGDEFNERGDIRAVLLKHGWEMVRGGENEYWRRPGKQAGWSATLRGNVFYVFSSNAAPFEPETSYGPFGVFAVLEHGGDYAAAADDLRRQGYGEPLIEVDISGITNLPAPKPAPQPLKIDLRLLDVPGFINDVVRHNLSTARHPQPELAFCGALALLSVLTGRRIKDSQGTRTNLYIICPAPSGSGKDHARKINKQILSGASAETEKLIGSEGIGSASGFVKSVALQPAILFQLDEVADLMEAAGDPKKFPHMQQLIPKLLQIYTTSDSLYVSDAVVDAKKVFRIPQPHAVVYGTCTPDSFWQSLSKKSLNGGFVGRLIAMEAGYVAMRPRVDETPIPSHLLEVASWWGNFVPSSGDLAAITNPQPQVIRTTEEAAMRQESQALEISRKAQGEDQIEQAVWTRSTERVSKLALLFAASRMGPGRPIPQVEIGDMERAIALSNFLCRSMLRRAAEYVADSEWEAKKLKVYRMIGQGISRNELTRKTQWLKDRDRREIIAELSEAGKVGSDVRGETKPMTWLYQTEDASKSGI